MSKEEIEKAKDDLRFFNEGDYITREMDKSAKILENYIEELEEKIQRTIDKLKGDRMEQLDDYVIYLQETYLKELGEFEDE